MHPMMRLGYLTLLIIVLVFLTFAGCPPTLAEPTTPPAVQPDSTQKNTPSEWTRAQSYA